MIVNISPVDIISTATKVEIVMIGFSLKATSGMCDVMFYNDTRSIKTERIIIPEDVYSIWGSDDQVIIDYVLNTLDLTQVYINETQTLEDQ